MSNFPEHVLSNVNRAVGSTMSGVASVGGSTLDTLGSMLRYPVDKTNDAITGGLRQAAIAYVNRMKLNNNQREVALTTLRHGVDAGRTLISDKMDRVTPLKILSYGSVGGAVGGAIGALLNKKRRLKGALMGAGVGAVGGVGIAAAKTVKHNLDYLFSLMHKDK